MKDLDFNDMFELAIVEIDNPNEQLTHIYQWYFERAIVSIKLTFGLGGSLVLSLLLAMFNENFKISTVQFGILMIGSGIIIIYGMYRFRSLRNLHKEYIYSLSLLKKLIPLVPFLKQYRSY